MANQKTDRARCHAVLTFKDGLEERCIHTRNGLRDTFDHDWHETATGVRWVDGHPAQTWLPEPSLYDETIETVATTLEGLDDVPPLMQATAVVDQLRNLQLLHEDV